MKKAIVTLVIGKKYENFFKYVKPNWDTYCQKYDIDLIIFNKHLDKSKRALSRSPAWQKCLILSQSEVKKYQQVCWLDADIVINPKSPDIFEGVPLEKIGAVDAYSIPTKEDHKILLRRLYSYWDKIGVKYIKNLTPTEYHRHFGLNGNFDNVVQTGVLILSPRYHKEILEYVYYNYEDKGGGRVEL